MDKILILLFFIGVASGLIFFAGWIIFLFSVVATTL